MAKVDDDDVDDEDDVEFAYSILSGAHNSRNSSIRERHDAVVEECREFFQQVLGLRKRKCENWGFFVESVQKENLIVR